MKLRIIKIFAVFAVIAVVGTGSFAALAVLRPEVQEVVTPVAEATKEDLPEKPIDKTTKPEEIVNPSKEEPTTESEVEQTTEEDPANTPTVPAQAAEPVVPVTATPAAAAATAQTPVTTATNRVKPFAGRTLYAGGHSQARDAADGIRTTDPEGAAKLDRIANTPQGIWIGQGTNMPYIGSLVTEANNLGQLPVVVVYGIRSMPCTGLPQSAEGYLNWVRTVKNAFGNNKVVLIIEPDELPITNCSSGESDRLDIVRQAVDILATNPGATIYIDAGHSAWVSVANMAQMLNTVGIAKVQGFSMNVSNYRTNSELISYGNQLSAATGGAHFVIDTSRNGIGPSADNQWCNTQGLKLGRNPEAASGLLDAYLWIKRPGESDGTCNGGVPEGQFHTTYAIDLAS